MLIQYGLARSSTVETSLFFNNFSQITPSIAKMKTLLLITPLCAKFLISIQKLTFFCCPTKTSFCREKFTTFGVQKRLDSDYFN